MMVVGPSQSGKTTFVLSLIHERKALFDQSPNRIVWCCAMKQAAPQNRGFVIIEGLPQLTDIRAYDLVVLDDLMMESSKSEDVTALFTRAVHHLPCFLIFLTQNLFLQSKEARTRHLNTHYLVLFKNPRDASAISHLARQMYPGEPKFLPAAYANATKDPHSYLFIDLRQETPDIMRLRTHILPHEWPTFTYVKPAVIEEELRKGGSIREQIPERLSVKLKHSHWHNKTDNVWVHRTTTPSTSTPFTSG